MKILLQRFKDLSLEIGWNLLEAKMLAADSCGGGV